MSAVYHRYRRYAPLSRLLRLNNWCVHNTTPGWCLLMVTTIFSLACILFATLTLYYNTGYQYVYDVLSQQEVDDMVRIPMLRKDCQLYAEMLQMINIKYREVITPLNVVDFIRRIYDVCIET